MSQQPPPYGEPQYPQQPQQPPHGQQPPGQQPGYQPYGQQQYPPNPYGVQQTKSNTTRNVLIIVTVLVVLFCGGIVGFGVWALNAASDGIDDAFDDEYRGSEDDPIAVEVGEEFSIRGLDYGEGWSVAPDTDLPGYLNVEGLAVTNNRDDEDSQQIFLVFEFLDGGQGVGEIRCSSDTSVRFEREVRMTCNSGEVPASYDAVEVYDDALYE